MASNFNAIPANPDTLITIKIAFDGSNRKFKLALRDLGVAVFSDKIRSILQVPNDDKLILERFSDSHNCYTKLEPENPSAYKQLYRAAKAKLKLRIKATVIDNQLGNTSVLEEKKEENVMNSSSPPSMEPPALTRTLPFQIPLLPSEPKNINRVKNNNASRARDHFFAELANISRDREIGLRMKEGAPAQVSSCTWQVFCNACDKPMTDVHYHCSICDDGDFDLCETCVKSGSLCQGEGHWLVKRSIQNGKVVSSTTELIATPRTRPSANVDREMPGSFTSDVKTEAIEPEPRRTCNSCVTVLRENKLVTCSDCDDYDLCMPCHVANKHGHHPGHAFKPIANHGNVPAEVLSLCNAGRNMQHAATCDGCDKSIVGVRFKCLNCPDWDYCGSCFKGAQQAHAGHRFVPVYGPLEIQPPSVGYHFGIYCDGPLCSGKANIRGIRYKCAICHDTDFCANCEAYPSNTHNHTHPLIKFKTPVRNVSVTTLDEDTNGEALATMGDRTSPFWSAHYSRTRAAAATPLPPYTPAEEQMNAVVKPTIDNPTQTQNEAKPETIEKLVDTVKPFVLNSSQLDAHFIEDTIADGKEMRPDSRFTQTWKLRNPGPGAWPRGCIVRLVGGDNMLDIDSDRPSSTHDLAKAQESNAAGFVEVGGEFSFTVSMRAPMREGHHISYWRLKAPDGTPFGHKLWCDIQVKSSISSNSFPSFQERVREHFGQQWSLKRAQMEQRRQEEMFSIAAAKTEGSNNPVPSKDDVQAPWKEDYSTRLAELEQENKIRLARCRLDGIRNDWSGSHHIPMMMTSDRSQDLALTNSQSQAVLTLAASVPATQPSMPQDLTPTASRAQSTKTGALFAYERQLELLRQQNKRRLQMARACASEIAVDEVETQAKGITETEPAVENAHDEKLETSVMVFPTLEKESPTSSTYHDAPASSIAPEQVPKAMGETATVDTATDGEHLKTFEDLESLELEESDGDDGFMTDEEYDILDASDEEVIKSGHPKV